MYIHVGNCVLKLLQFIATKYSYEMHFLSVQLISVHDCYTLPESNEISLIFVFGYGKCTITTVHYTVLIIRSSP